MAEKQKGLIHMGDYKKIRGFLNDDEILCQLAEEAAELSQAALKLRRALTGTNPTPVTAEKALEGLCEEMADVDIALNAFLYGFGNREYLKFNDNYRFIYREKLNRWEERLENK